MTWQSALKLAQKIESVALEAAHTLQDTDPEGSATLCTSVTCEGGTIDIDITRYAEGKFFGLARTGNLVGRVRVDGDKAKILSIELDRSAG